MSKKTPWWQNFQVIAYVVAGLTAFGTATVVLARYITLPKTVEAAVQKNTQQDEALNKLGTIADQNQKLLDKWDKIYEGQQQAPNQAAPRSPFREWDDTDQAFYCCDSYEYERDVCHSRWYRCL